MVFEVRIPDLGQVMTGGSVLERKKELGDLVQAGDSLPAIVADDRTCISGYKQIP